MKTKNSQELFEKSTIDQEKIKYTNTSEKNPIFVLGMPRSGTTLVEQILSSHSNV